MPNTNAHTTEHAGIEVGAIFESSWGWEQTNVDFYEVVGVTAASVKVRKIGQRAVSSGSMTAMVVAEPGHFLDDAKPATKRLRRSPTDGRPSFRCDYGNAYLWDGEPVYSSSYA